MTACQSGGEVEEKREELKALMEEMKALDGERDELQVKIDTVEHQIALLDTSVTELSGILVNTIELEPKLFEHYFGLSGVVQSDVDVTISPEAVGTLKRILVKEGQRVRKGQLLAELNTTVGRSGVEEVETQLELVKILYDKRKKLWDQIIGSEVEYLQAKTNYESLQKKLQTTKNQLNLSAIYSSANGTIEKIYTKQGELLSPGVPFASLVSLQNVYIEADVPENYLGKVNKGDKVRVTIPGELEARLLSVTRIGNVINPGNRSFKMQLAIPNKSESVKLNAICALEICDFRQANSLAVPSNIIQQDIHGYFVYLVKQKDNMEIAIKTNVEIGPTNEGYTLIVSGVSEKDEVITDGYNEVSNNALIQRQKLQMK